MLPLVSYGEYADGTDRDGRPPDRYITFSTMDAASVQKASGGENYLYLRLNCRISLTRCRMPPRTCVILQ